MPVNPPLMTMRRRPGLWAFVGPAFALAITGTPVRAANTCTVTVTPLVFGNYNPVSGPALQINATLTASCASTTLPLAAVPYTISIGPSSGSGTMARALIGSAGSRLQYNVYTSSSHITVWGDGSGGSMAVSGSVTPLALGVPAVGTHTAYGRVPAEQVVRTGVYVDSLLVTIDY